MHRRAGELAGPWQAIALHDPAGLAVVHGDLHGGNVVPSTSGPLLTDLELSGVGPPSYDVAPTAVAVRRYGAPADDLDRFVAATGLDPRAWTGWPVCLDVYELWVTAWAVGVRDRDAAWATEADDPRRDAARRQRHDLAPALMTVSRREHQSADHRAGVAVGEAPDDLTGPGCAAADVEELAQTRGDLDLPPASSRPTGRRGRPT